jgi:hypothetical protein
MRAYGTLLTLTLYLLPASSVLRADDAGAEIPTVGRPADLPFSGGSGDFRVRAEATPTTLEAQHPLTLTLHVTAIGEVRQAPHRIDLRALPSFKSRFDFPEWNAGAERQPDQRTWEFVYRLQPKREDVATVPGIPFVFYNPEIQYPRKGFQVAYTDPISLTVTPHQHYVGPLVIPPFASVAAGPQILEDGRSWLQPGPAAVASVLVAPPLACVAWFLCWRRFYPDAARRAQQRRSAAARRALQDLRGAGRLPAGLRAERVAAVTAEYLRSRFDAPAVEPTPDEAAASLTRAGCSPGLADQAAAFFRDCDATRFAPAAPVLPHAGGERRERGSPDLAEAAARFILAVEAETWSPSRS